MANNLSKRKKFISFSDQIQPGKIINTNLDEELVDLSIKLSIESSKLLHETSAHNEIDHSMTRQLAESIKMQAEEILRVLPISPPSTLETSSMAEILKSYKVPYPTYYKEPTPKNPRTLDNGGLAPPKKTVTNIHLGDYEKSKLIQEMRAMKLRGQTITKSHAKTPANIKEFTDTFKYLENISDYNGSFLVNLLKSEIEITAQATMFQVDLSPEKQRCLDGECVILSIYDISGSASSGEEKKFLVILFFDSLHGQLTYLEPVFTGRKKLTLSHRQVAEMERFCIVKKINTTI
jgi:hypothetical protein